MHIYHQEKIINTSKHLAVDLGLKPAIAMTDASTKTFFYREKHKRILGFRTIDAHQFERIPGPLVYVVSDNAGVIRYVGRHLANTPLRSRWMRHGYIHHQESSRNCYIAHIESGRGELTVSCASASEIHSSLPTTRSIGDPSTLVSSLEALWIRRYGPQLWNIQTPSSALLGGFTDGLS